jgi:hypothetical protein
MTDTVSALLTPRFFRRMIGRVNFSVRRILLNCLTIYFVVVFPISYGAE